MPLMSLIIPRHTEVCLCVWLCITDVPVTALLLQCAGASDSFYRLPATFSWILTRIFKFSSQVIAYLEARLLRSEICSYSSCLCSRALSCQSYKIATKVPLPTLMSSHCINAAHAQLSIPRLVVLNFKLLASFIIRGVQT